MRIRANGVVLFSVQPCLSESRYCLADVLNELEVREQIGIASRFWPNHLAIKLKRVVCSSALISVKATKDEYVNAESAANIAFTVFPRFAFQSAAVCVEHFLLFRFLAD